MSARNQRWASGTVIAMLAAVVFADTAFAGWGWLKKVVDPREHLKMGARGLRGPARQMRREADPRTHVRRARWVQQQADPRRQIQQMRDVVIPSWDGLERVLRTEGGRVIPPLRDQAKPYLSVDPALHVLGTQSFQVGQIQQIGQTSVQVTIVLNGSRQTHTEVVPTLLIPISFNDLETVQLVNVSVIPRTAIVITATEHVAVNLDLVVTTQRVFHVADASLSVDATIASNTFHKPIIVDPFSVTLGVTAEGTFGDAESVEVTDLRCLNGQISARAIGAGPNLAAVFSPCDEYLTIRARPLGFNVSQTIKNPIKGFLENLVEKIFAANEQG